jgi:hypothetical protein
MTRYEIGLLVALATGLITATSGALAEEGHSLPHSHLALFVGAGQESHHGTSHSEKATGFEYEFRFEEKWGIGAVLESVQVNHHTNTVLVVPFSFHPGGNWRLFAGAGYEFTKKKDKLLIRLGGGYEFHLNDHWTIAPEIVLDSVEGGANSYLLGIAIGYGF